MQFLELKLRHNFRGTSRNVVFVLQCYLRFYFTLQRRIFASFRQGQEVHYMFLYTLFSLEISLDSEQNLSIPQSSSKLSGLLPLVVLQSPASVSFPRHLYPIWSFMCIPIREISLQIPISHPWNWILQVTITRIVIWLNKWTHMKQWKQCPGHSRHMRNAIYILLLCLKILCIKYI